MYHNNYNHNKNNDTNSFGSSVDTPDPEIPEDMTEEKAMEIWLRKDDEIRARMIREEEMAAERAAAEPYQEAVLGEQLYHQQLQQQPNNQGGIEAAAAQQHYQSTNSEYDMSYDSDSCGDSNLPLAIPAAQSNSAAWQDAISHNPINPNDPAQHETWLAYERFIQLNKPGVADNYVPSTPGLARLIEEQREEERRALVRKTEQQQARAAAAAAEAQEQQSTSSPSSTSLRREEYVNQQILRMQQQHQCQWDNNNNYASGFNTSAYGAQHHQQQMMSAHQMGASSMSTSQGLYTSHAAQGTQARGGGLPPLVMDDDVYRRYHQEQQQQRIPAIDPQDPLILAQARELERISHERKLSAAQTLNDGRGSNTTAYPPSRNINSFDVVATPSTPPLDDLKPAAKKSSDSSSLSSESFYLATPQCTQYNTQPVICSHCQAPLHTHPLALNYFCQQCCRVTRKDEGGAEYRQGQVGQKSEWGESKYEEKMMEGEDYLDQDDMMGIGSWGSSR